MYINGRLEQARDSVKKLGLLLYDGCFEDLQGRMPAQLT